MKRFRTFLLPLLLGFQLVACAKAGDHSSIRLIKADRPHDILLGAASWYGRPFHGHRTANGEIFNMNEISAAHKSLPFGAWLKVTNLENNRHLLVRVNDRGPYTKGRILDLSYAAAQNLDMLHKGVASVRVEVFLPQTEAFLTRYAPPALKEKARHLLLARQVQHFE